MITIEQAFNSLDNEFVEAIADHLTEEDFETIRRIAAQVMGAENDIRAQSFAVRAFMAGLAFAANLDSVDTGEITVRFTQEEVNTLFPNLLKIALGGD